MNTIAVKIAKMLLVQKALATVVMNVGKDFMEGNVRFLVCLAVNHVRTSGIVQLVKRDILAKIITTNANALINTVHDVMLEYVPSALHCSGILMTAVVAHVAVTVKITHVSVIELVLIAVRENMETSVWIHVVVSVETAFVIEMEAVSLAKMIVDMQQTATNIALMLFQIVPDVLV